MTLERVSIGTLPYDQFAPVLTSERYGAFAAAIARSRDVLDGRVIWNINSTSRGGGVAEMLVSLLAYAHGAGVDARWDVIPGNTDFFALTKRLHNYLHASPGDGGPVGDDERRIYESTLAPSLDELQAVVSPRDIVLVHDPQPAGLIPGLKRLGVPVIWRCHVGVDRPDDRTRLAWDFLRPYVAAADTCVFSRPAFVWDGLDTSKVEVVPPVIDAFSPKNQELDDQTVVAILDAAGIIPVGGSRATPTFTRMAGSRGEVTRRADMRERTPVTVDDPLVVQVSRWDRLKDPIGVIQGFADHIAPHTGAHLVYAGPSVAAIADDPEGRSVLDEAYALFDALPSDRQDRIHLACLPMDDLEENAAIVNALQRHAAVVVQKSIAEGFGLTVAEAMWKDRPVVASKVGGIQDQITDGVDGILLDDPLDLLAYGEAVASLLADPVRSGALGRAAHDRVRDRFLVVRSLLQYFDLIERLLD